MLEESLASRYGVDANVLIEKIEFVEVQHAGWQRDDGIAFRGGAIHAEDAVLARGADAARLGSRKRNPIFKRLGKTYAASRRQ